MRPLYYDAENFDVGKIVAHVTQETWSGELVDAALSRMRETPLSAEEVDEVLVRTHVRTGSLIGKSQFASQWETPIGRVADTVAVFLADLIRIEEDERGEVHPAEVANAVKTVKVAKAAIAVGRVGEYRARAGAGAAPARASSAAPKPICIQNTTQRCYATCVTKPTKIQRNSLRNQVRDELLERMRSGAVEPGEGISEVQLAAELGVSRTPLREALIGLAEVGQLEWIEGKGFKFKPLSAEELLELAPILASLESLAIELTPEAERVRIGRELLELAEAFAAEKVELALVTAKDDEWHSILTSGCTNQKLLALLQNTRQSFHRYEHLLVPDSTVISRVAAEHIEIARALVGGDLAAAQRALGENWRNGAKRTADLAMSSVDSQ